MRFRVTMVHAQSKQKSEQIVEAADERAAGWAVLQGGHQLLSVEAIETSAAYPASQPPVALGPPARPPNRRTVMLVVWTLGGIGAVITAWAIGQLVPALSQVRLAEAEYAPVEKRLNDMRKSGDFYTRIYEGQANPVLERLNAVRGVRNRALNWLAAGVVLLVLAASIWGWLRFVEQRWATWQRSAAELNRSADPPSPAG
jgi:hypothetical protein